MRKRLAVILCLTVSLVFAGCSSGKDTSDSSAVSQSQEETSVSSSGEDEDSSAEASEELKRIPVAEGEFELADCVELGKYQGLTLEKPSVEITEEDVDSYIRSFMEQETVTDPDAQAREGDTVNIAFEGTRDGEAFEGGSSDSYDLVLGSGRMIPGFEEGIIGMKIGETKDLNLTFPEDYQEESLQGAHVVFSVAVNSIRRAPEPTDAWVEEYTEGEYTTVEEYRISVREQLAANQENSARYTMQQEAWNQIAEDTVFKQLPKSYVEEGETEFDSSVEQEAAAYGMDKDAYIQAAGLSTQEYQEQKELYGRSAARSRLLLDALAEAEGLTADSPEYQAEVENLANTYGMDKETLISTYGEEAVRQYAMTQAVLDRVLEAARITEAASDSAEE